MGDVARVKTLSRREFERMSTEEVVDFVPFRVRVGVVRWFLVTAMVAALAWVMVFALFFDEAGTTPGGSVFKALMWVGLPLAVVFLPGFRMATLFPRHLTVSEEGLSTRSWQVRWDQVRTIGYNGAGQESAVKASFRVPPELWESGLREGNRWDSGRPLGAGGLTSSVPLVNTQPNLVPSVRALSEVFEVLLHRAWERAGQTGGFDERGPVVPDGRRTVAPNTPAEDAVA